MGRRRKMRLVEMVERDRATTQMWLSHPDSPSERLIVTVTQSNSPAPHHRTTSCSTTFAACKAFICAHILTQCRQPLSRLALWPDDDPRALDRGAAVPRASKRAFSAPPPSGISPRVIIIISALQPNYGTPWVWWSRAAVYKIGPWPDLSDCPPPHHARLRHHHRPPRPRFHRRRVLLRRVEPLRR
jgi:hypothetical protein